jgi:hypothetical protein
MKFAAFLGLILFTFIVSPLGATTLSDLDAQQSKLAAQYMNLLDTLPSPTEISLLAQTGYSPKVKESLASIHQFFISYDEFNLAKIDFFHEKVLEHARIVALDHHKTYGSLPKKALIKLKAMENLRAKYLEFKPYFRTEKDTERLDVAHDFFPAYGDFANSIRKSRGEHTWRKYGSGKIVPSVDTLKDALKVSDKLVVLLWNAYFRKKTGKQDVAPIPEALGGIQKELVSMRGIKTQWDGLENLEDTSHDGKTLNMFLINHANSFLDSSAQQAFPVKGISAMGNMDVFFPKFLVKQMVKSDHMISVGHGDTTGKAIEMVQSKRLNKFFLAIEGITGSGLYEMRPIMPIFQLAVYDAINRGLELKLYPIAFPDNFRLINDWRAPIEGTRIARGVVSSPINNLSCLGLLKITGETSSIAELIRWTWFTSLRNTSDEVLSMPYPSEIAKRIDLMIWEK